MADAECGFVAYAAAKGGVIQLTRTAADPIGRPGRAEEVAEVVVWLCSDAASFVTEYSMLVDGGMTAA